IIVGCQRDIDAAKRCDLFLPIGSTDCGLNDHKPVGRRISFEFKTSHSDKTSTLDNFCGQRFQLMPRLGSSATYYCAADSRRFRSDFLASKDADDLAKPAAVEKAKVDIAIRPRDPFLDDDFLGPGENLTA